MTRQLPPRPSFEHLRNEAKALLKAHRNRDTAACAVLRHLRQFTDCTDADIIATHVTLHDMQFALAMDYGFPSWSALKKQVDAMTATDAIVSERLQHARQHLRWQPKWTTLVGCTKSCLDFLGLEMSFEWLFGGTGHAFFLNFSPVVCPSHPTA